MATKNGLEQAMALLINSQATLANNQASFLTHLAETHKRQNEADARFARIENDLDQIKTILLRHEQTLNQLPEAIRQKIGYKPR